tara:strand:+ start:5241 stop:6089 length:849 start_codon:yes stop_codon:yes gene_type:complete
MNKKLDLIKVIVKRLIRTLGKTIAKTSNIFPFNLISDAFLIYKLDQRQKIKIDEHSVYLATPNFLTRYRYKTFFTKEPETLSWIDSFEKGSVFYDVGANIGLYSIYAVKKRQNQVFCFEPSFFNLEFLVRNISYNNLEKEIAIFPIALDDKISLSKLDLYSTEWGGALSTFDKEIDSYGNKTQSKFSYNTMGFDLDTLVSIYKIPLPDYIKIDVDGIEHYILKGSDKAINNAKGVLIEINDDFKEQKKMSEKYLKKAGFRCLQKTRSESHEHRIHNQIWTKF